MIERPSGNIRWQIGAPPLAQQHDPRPLPNGNILIFDNGTHRRDNPATFSRVIEVDPRTNDIVWQYADQSIFNFFSPYISGAQRLANGNTLICEGCHGRLFDVARVGTVAVDSTHIKIHRSAAGKKGASSVMSSGARATAGRPRSTP